MRKKCDQQKLLKFEAEGRDLANFLRSLEHSIQTVKGQKNYWWQNAFFKLVPGGFSDLMYSNGKKWLRFRNLQEKLE